MERVEKLVNMLAHQIKPADGYAWTNEDDRKTNQLDMKLINGL